MPPSTWRRECPCVGPYFPNKHWVSGLPGWHHRQGMPGCPFRWVGTERGAYRFSIPPVEHRACDFHRTRRSTFGRSPWLSMKRLFPFPQLHSAFSMDSLRVRWVPLVPSFQRLGAFAPSPHPGVRGFPTRRLLCPCRLFLRALAFRWGLPYLLPARLPIPQRLFETSFIGGISAVHYGHDCNTIPYRPH